MKVIYINNKNRVVKRLIENNTHTIPKKLIASVSIGILLGMITQNVGSMISWTLAIYIILSSYIYAKILTNKLILTILIGTLITTLAIYFNLWFLPLIDIVLIALKPLFKKQYKYKDFKINEDETNEREYNIGKDYKFFRNCTEENEIKKRYHELIKEFHPDNAGENETFQRIQEEYNQIKKDIQYEESNKRND